MEISQIEADLKDTNSQQQLKAITELKNYGAEIAVPLLLTVMREPDFLVRSFVAMGLGKQLTSDSFAALLEMMKFDRDPNVRAEAANSLSMFGAVAAPHLRLVFIQDDNWLVRRSILAALVELNCPEELFEVCTCGIVGEDLTVQADSMNGLAFLGNTPWRDAALAQLLSRVKAPHPYIRRAVARALGKFEGEEVRLALSELREDEDHQVVGAALEELLYRNSGNS